MKQDANISEIKKFVENLSFDEIKNKAKNVPYNFQVVENDNLYMLSFTENSNLALNIVRAMNGVIFEKNTNKLLHYSFPKAYEGVHSPYFENEKDCYKKMFNQPYEVEISTEGTHIKVFWYEGEWKVSTSRSIEAGVSFWNSDKSFKEMFYETCKFEDINLEDLDKNFCYSFIMQHPENKICSDISIHYCNMINKVNLEENTVIRTTEGFIVDYSVELLMEKIRQSSANLNYIVYLEDSSRVKITNNNFKKLQKLLKNDSNIQKDYLKALQQGTSEEMKKNLKDNIAIFERVESILDITIKSIHESYKNNFIYKKNEQVYFKFWKILNSLHWIYRKTSEKIHYGMIFNFLLDMPLKDLVWALDIGPELQK
jgi:hypothetical protein